MGIGADLRRAREQRGWSLSQLASRTKIAVSTLTAIEAERFSGLPEGFYRRAFLRSYAREVGLDAEEIVQRYLNDFEQEPAPPAQPEIAAESREERWPIYADWFSAPVQFALVTLFGTAALAGLVYFNSRQRPAPEPAVNTTSSRPQPQQGGDPPAVGTVGTAAAKAGDREESAAAPLRVTLQALGPCWVSATADAHRLVYRQLNKGEQAVLQAQNEVTLRIGDAGALQWTINGAPGRPLGQAGEIATLHITPSNYRTFLR
jgi:cytoskeletal protein RodZ